MFGCKKTTEIRSAGIEIEELRRFRIRGEFKGKPFSALVTWDKDRHTCSAAFDGDDIPYSDHYSILDMVMEEALAALVRANRHG